MCACEAPQPESVESFVLEALRTAMASESRLQLMFLLLQKRAMMTVSDLAKETGLSLSMVSRHLQALHEAGLLERDKQSRKVYYRIPGTKLAQVLRNLADFLESCCP